MKRIVTFCLFVCLLTNMPVSAQDWAPAGEKIKTRWASEVDPHNPLPEYPRPQLKRVEWMSLNGLWDYTICASNVEPDRYENVILVPYPIESSLSGVMKVVDPGCSLWYKRVFIIPENWNGQNIILNFGAVDYETEVYVNGQFVGKHIGGYTAFSFDITDYISHEIENELIVKVTDETDENIQAVGKQRRNPAEKGSIWYTSVTGIWQTVWIEPVSPTYVSAMYASCDISSGDVSFDFDIVGDAFTDIQIKIYDDAYSLVSEGASSNNHIVCSVNNPCLWSPDDPYLYNVRVELQNKGMVIDEFSSYIGMREISTKQDENGLWHLQLNKKNLFQLGLLDQGYWPDGLYTAPTEKALLFDIEKTKEWGFNLIRKHMKVEPARWYYHCDRLGVLVWQDMPAIRRSDQEWISRDWYVGTEGSHSEEVERNYKREWKEIVCQHFSNPCIVVWTPFNEAWGQFKTEEIVDYTKSLDATRLVNSACGGNHLHTGDFLSIHDYSCPPSIFLYDNVRPTVLGEYGGLGFNIAGHRWVESDSKTYVNYKNTEELTNAYVNYTTQVLNLASGVEDVNGNIKSICAAIYTQTTDVETEYNGMMTYNRAIEKMDINAVKKLNEKFFDDKSETTNMRKIDNDVPRVNDYYSLGGVCINRNNDNKDVLVESNILLVSKNRKVLSRFVKK